MVERTVAVRFTARVDAYMAAMAKAAAATGAFSATSQRNLTKLGTGMQSVGKKMTMFVSAPIAGLAALSTKMAADFETSFAQMVGLANVPAEEIDHLRESVLSLAGETAQAPQELAEGLYLAASAGLDSATAMDVVEVAAHGAAAGMGETATIVDLLTSVIGAYGEENISAAEAADVLTAAVREGKAAPDEMASALGRILPISSALGISFGETAGAIAFLTNVGLDTDEAVTSLRGTMLALIKPSAGARDTLQAAGISMDDMRAAIQEDGLMGALDLLRAHGFDDNTEALAHVIENSRALVGAQALLDDSSGNLTSILDATENSTGALGDAFAAVSDTDAFALKQALTDIKTAMIEVGAILLPIVADIAHAISGLTQFFVDMPGPVQTAVIALGGMLAIGGPLVMVAGSLIKNFKAISTALQLLPAGAGVAGLAISAGLALGVSAYLGFTQQQRETDKVTKDVAAALDGQVASLFSVAAAAVEAGGEIDGVAIANEALSLSLSEGFEDLGDTLASLNIGAGETLDILSQYDKEPLTAIQALAEAYGLTRQQAAAFVQLWERNSPSDMADNQRAFAAAVGITDEQYANLVGTLFVFEDQVKKVDLDAIAETFLNGRVKAQGYEESLVAAAEAQTGFQRQTGHGMELFRAWSELVGEADAETMASAAGYEELAASVGETGTAYDVLTGKLRDSTTGLEVAGEAVQAFYDKTQPARAGLKEFRLRLEDATSKAIMLAEQVPPLAEKLHVLHDDAGDAATGLDDVAESGVSASDAFDQLGRAVDANWLQQLRELSGLQGPSEGWINVLGLTEIEQFGTNLHRVLDPQQEFIRSQDAIRQAAVDFTAAMDEGTTSLDENTGAGLTNRGMLMDWLDDIEAGAYAQLAAGDSIADVNATLAYNVEALRAAAYAAGFNKDEVDDLIDTYLNVPESVETAIQLNGDDIAMKKIEALLLQMDIVDEGVIAEVNAVIEADGAWAGYHYLVDYINTHKATVPVDADVSRVYTAISNAINAFRFASIVVGVSGHAKGGYFNTPTAGVFGEAGPEVILPLSNPARMSELLGMAEVGPHVAAAFGNLSGHGHGGGGGGGTSIGNVNVYMPPGSDGDDVVRALRQWERRRGPIPVTVR